MIEDPEAGCVDVRFERRVRLSPDGEGALEDYARALTQAHHAEGIPDASDPLCLAGVHLCGAETVLIDLQRHDLEAFAREMELPGTNGGLGWN